MQEIVPGIHVEFAYPPYNLGVIETDVGAVVVDVPPRPSHAWAWRHQVEEMVGRPNYVVITDASPERQLAAANWDVPIIASEGTLRTIAKHDERSWRELLQKMAERYPEESDAVLALKPHRPTVAFSYHFLLHHRTPPLTFETAEGPAPGGMWLLVPEHRLAFTGDIVVLGEPAPLLHCPNSKAWLNTLKSLVHRASIHHIVPGRGRAPIHSGDVEEQREYLRVMRRTARVLERKDPIGNYKEPAQDLGQTFFNAQGQKAARRIKADLRHLVSEIRERRVMLGEEMQDDDDDD